MKISGRFDGVQAGSEVGLGGSDALALSAHVPFISGGAQVGEGFFDGFVGEAGPCGQLVVFDGC